jgi:hypothetical protein
MRSTVCALGTIVAWAVLATAASAADDVLSAPEAKALVSGNSYTVFNPGQDSTGRHFSDADGSQTKITKTGQFKRGMWQIKSDGSYCIEFQGKATCGLVHKKEGGAYHLVKNGIPIRILSDFKPGNDLR